MVPGKERNVSNTSLSDEHVAEYVNRALSAEREVAVLRGEKDQLQAVIERINKELDEPPFRSSYESDCCCKAYSHGEDDAFGGVAMILRKAGLRHDD